MSASPYRVDVQVLRGIAVLSVLLFHGKENLFSLGYLGVDVFFVISGFVVTPLIMSAVDNVESLRERLKNLKNFYKRRIYRLVPALGTTLIISFALIILFGNLVDHKRFANQGIATLLGIGNIGAILFSGDYFSPNPNPLVHTWSLSVEEQIYLLLPLALLLFVGRKKIKSNKALIIFTAMTVTSGLIFLFPGTVYSPNFGLDNSTSLSFYSPLSRVWQFSLGGIIYLVNTKFRITKFKSLTALNTLLCVVLLTLVFPYLELEFRVGSILASTSAASILLFRSLLILPSRLIRLLHWIGDRSYSIYLIHMPLLYIVNYSPIAIFSENKEIGVLAGITLSIYLGHVNYIKVEQKFRQSSVAIDTISIKKVFTYFVIFPMLLFIILAFFSRQNYDSHQASLRGCVDTEFDAINCLWNSEGDKGLVLVVGDSQAYATADGVISAANQLGFQTIVSSISGCPFLDVDTSGDKTINCRAWQNDVLDFILRVTPDFVVIANRTNGYVNPESGWRTFLDTNEASISSRTEALPFYLDSLDRVFRKITAAGSRVILIQNIPEASTMRGDTLFSKLTNYNKTKYVLIDKVSIDSEVANAESSIAKDYPGVRIVNLQKLFCTKIHCLVIEDGRDIFQDSWHISEYGSLKIVPKLLAALSSKPQM